ncbi:MAG: T9SS type A sorting domain-containing protein [Candidatus Eisenbacteria bacterium]|uniref:T9SS type A sorting domain-containing protein n=1 Tax=Eiseniibacteriota bacterium TaxID=2212470 RepID=A0A538U867_UNCEI|nr:MAG: T9SS type A sorting domain-containing protein [Candidatus Eisenbacteria bacterium]
MVDAARPNPFATRTSIRLTLDAAAAVDVGVYDLAGRRLATLHAGPLAIGVHTFDWDGRPDDGGAVRSGVYFVRAGVVGHPATTQKLVMVRGD